MSTASIIRKTPLTVEKQEATEWCWAEVSVSVDRMFRPNSTHTQCELAGGVLGLQCCSGSHPGPPDACNTTHELNPVLGRLHLLASEPLVRALTFTEVQKQIDGGQPVCVLIKWVDQDGQPGTRGHFIAISGYRVTPALKQFVAVEDPFYGPSETDYSIFASKQGGYRDGRGVWFASFLVAMQG